MEHAVEEAQPAQHPECRPVRSQRVERTHKSLVEIGLLLRHPAEKARLGQDQPRLRRRAAKRQVDRVTIVGAVSAIALAASRAVPGALAATVPADFPVALPPGHFTEDRTLHATHRLLELRRQSRHVEAPANKAAPRDRRTLAQEVFQHDTAIIGRVDELRSHPAFAKLIAT